ncbi:MAG: T9SS type B sorting domain-containing protein [Bacteroidetes bacterium]|nr:T9SS type B sorting domain-containing protein [Bacteroidota bacterium]
MFARKLKSVLLCFFILNSISAFAQKNYNVWFFGNSTGLDFNYNPPKVVTDFNGHFSYEGTSSVCDSSGQLMFYTNGDTVFNRQHQILYNSFQKNYHRQDAQQAAICLPVIGYPDKYFAILGVSMFGAGITPGSRIHYDLIDMKGDGGLGESIVTEAALPVRGEENFGVARHANGKDYWIASWDRSKPNYVFKAVRSDGPTFTDSVEQSFGSARVSGYLGNKFSPDSKIFVGNRIYKNGNTYLTIYRFNNNTGFLSDSILIFEGTGFNYRFGFNLEFSHDSRYLYIVKHDLSDPDKIIQLDLSVWDEAAVQASATLIYSDINNIGVSGMQLGQDQKIYVIWYTSDFISTIDYPYNAGTNCGFVYKKINLNPGSSQYGGPYYPNFWSSDNLYLTISNDTIICKNGTANLKVELSENVPVIWSTGDTTKNISVTDEGWYWVEATNKNGTAFRDSVHVLIGPKRRVYLGPDTAFCDEFKLLLNAGNHYRDYLWSTMDTVSSITVDSAGNYWVEVADSNSCPDADTIAIDQIKKPEIDLQLDSVNCEFVFLKTHPPTNSSILWSTGSIDTAIGVNKKGRYYLTSSNAFCSRTDSIDVDVLPRPEVNLGSDLKLCDELIHVFKTNETGEFEWSDQSTDKQLIYENKFITKPDTIWLRISRNGCSASDTVVILPCLKTVVFIPNAFSPGNGFVNDFFGVTGLENPQMFDLKIYNRWGELIFVSTHVKDRWDGTFEGVSSPTGAYLYMLEAVSEDGERIHRAGTVTVVK